MSEILRIAMWSGPRNLSTAMMRSFGSRADTHVIDEPFYGAYLAQTGLNHPMRDEILNSMSQDPDAVSADLLGAIENGKSVYYQKHMTQHMIAGIPRDWANETAQVFLIRHPARVIASYAAKRENPTLDDLGFAQQAELFDACHAPIVIEAEDILRAPEPALRALCSALALDWDPAMLSWQKGPHKADGIWGAHWYQSIWASTAFTPWHDKPLPDVSDKALLGAAMDIYERLRVNRLRGE